MIAQRFAARLLNRPQLIAPAAGAAVLEALLPGARLVGFGPDQPEQDQRRDREYQLLGGTAIIPVVGELVHRGAWMDALSGVCSYQAIADMTADALRDPAVTGLILDMDTPGGEAAGCLDFAEWLAAQRGAKPMWAMVNQLSCSAGYAIASACDRILIGASAYAGSIGVVAYHADVSKALKSMGVEVTYIYAGARKIDGAPELPLSAEARSAAQSAVDAEYDRFCRVVAANRGMTLEAVAATEAGIYRGQDAVSAGLADAIATPEEALAAMSTTTTVTAPSGARMNTPAPAAAPAPSPALAPAPGPTAPREAGEPVPPAPKPDEPAPDTAPAPAQAVADACTKAGHAGLIAGFLQQGASMATVTARLADADAIMAVAKPLGLASMAGTLVKSGVGLEDARAILFDARASGEDRARTDPTGAGAQKPPAMINHRAVYGAFRSAMTGKK